MNISILHLSDLHIKEKDGTFSETLNHLVEDIEKQCKYLEHIILAITGDIVDQALYNELNKKIVIEFFSKIKEKIGDKIVGVEIVPGNHDKKRNEINKNMIDQRRTSDEISNINIEDWKYYLVPYHEYIELMNEIRNLFNKNSKIIRNSYYIETIDEEDFKIIFINVDTSWSSYGGAADKRNLCIDKTQLNELKETYQKEKRATTKKYLTVMMAHHPLNWLKEKDEALLSSWLLEPDYFNINFYLCGHTHDRQIKSFFDTYKSYITLVTGIGWDESAPEEEKNKHRYSIYNLALKNKLCEIIIRKTRADGVFDYDNDVLLTEEEKEDKRIYLPLEHFGVVPKIEIPIFINNTIKREYLFVDKEVLVKMKKISKAFSNIANHMALFQSMHIRDFFVKYELNKTSRGTVIKQEIYDDYFYKNMQNQKVDELFENIKNHSIIYDNFLAYLRELCGTVITELVSNFKTVEHIRLHIRRHFINEKGEVLYIAICQAIKEKESPPVIRDISYENSMIKIAYEKNTPLVYIHNKVHNPLNQMNKKYENFITIAPNNRKNNYIYWNKDNVEVQYPFLTSSLSITCENNSNMLDILNYLDIGEFVFKMIYEYVSLFKIDMEKFICSLGD